MKVFVVGGAGFIGSNICRDLIDQGIEPIVFDAFIQYISPFESSYQKYLDLRFKDIKDKITFIRGDTRNKNEIIVNLEKYQPEVIIHLANIPIADLSYRHPEEAVSNNINGTVNLLDAIKEKEFVNRFVYISSSMVYGDFVEDPIREDQIKRPKEIYGSTKLAAEILTETYGRRYGIKYTIIRPSAVYGPTDVNRRVVQIFLENALQGKKLVLHGDAQKLDFTYVKDTAKGIIQAALSPKGENEIFNITRGEGRSLMDLANILKTHFPSLEVEVMPAQKHRPQRGGLNISKARELIGYKPKYTLEAGIEEYVMSMKELLS